MKSKIKVTNKLLDSLDMGITKEELPENACVKRIHYESDIDEVRPHDDNYFAVGTITTIDVDSDGDVVLPKAIDMSRYEKNPVVLFNHNLANPIGYAEQIHVNEDKIIAKTRFGTTPEAQKVHQLVKDKVLRTHSIGFITRNYKVRGEQGFDELLKSIVSTYPERFDEIKSKKVDRIITDALLVEYSIVTVPANQEAVINEIKKAKEEVERKQVTEEKLLEEPVLGEEEEQELLAMEILEEAETKGTEDETKEIEVKEAEQVHEQVSGDEKVEVIEETETKDFETNKVSQPKPQIKMVKRASKCKLVKTKEQIEADKRKQLYLKLWGV
jgi:HK97 family phage prohead protease